MRLFAEKRKERDGVVLEVSDTGTGIDVKFIIYIRDAQLMIVVHPQVSAYTKNIFPKFSNVSTASNHDNHADVKALGSVLPSLRSLSLDTTVRSRSSLK